MDSVNINNTGKNTVPAKPLVKTIYLDASGNMSRAGAFMGVAFLFLCIFAVCLGLTLCLDGSFGLGLDMAVVLVTLAASILFFTLIYFLPSKIFTALAFLAGAGGLALYAVASYNIPEAAYYTLNLCLYRIQEAGYRIVVDNSLAETVNATTAGYVTITAVLFCVLVAALFSYLVYSKKNIVYSLLISVAVVFPGFFYGLIPPYFAFSLVASFWVSQFAINIFESGHMAYLISKENTIPDKKLAKIKLKAFKKQYRADIRSIKSEIRTIVKSPNRNENSIRLDKLVRQLKSVSPNEGLFLMVYGLLDKKSKKRSSGRNSFHDPVKAEKRRLETEAREKIAADRLAKQNEKKEIAKIPASERLKARFADNLKNKKRYSVKSGYAGIFAFVTALFAVTAVQPFISPQAKFDLSMPEQIMDFLTSTIEYTLVGSDASVYGGYNGGMGGGFLYRPGGAKFKDKAILQLSSATDSNALYLRSTAIYLKGWTGSIYTGNMWLEADKKQLEAFEALVGATPLPRFRYMGEKNFFRVFTESMQNVFGASYQRRGAELKEDKIKIEHLVAGGRRSFLPYFFDSYEGGHFRFKDNADLYVQITNSLFSYPVYTAEFASVDNVLNRAGPVATDDLKEYLGYYRSYMDTSLDTKSFLSLLNPDELEAAMPDVQFFSSMSAIPLRIFDRLVEEGEFIEYSAPSPELAGELRYHGYIHVPYKYNDIIDAVKVRYNMYSANAGGLGAGFMSPDFVDSEVLYGNFAREYYLGLPSDFPEEVRALALEITAGCDTDYEKALAMEKYLAQTYTYTLNPSIPTDTRADFVYNFLFDQKEGYCTAYASAMVTMMRSLGVPARYAEGYLVDTSKKSRDEFGKEYIVVYDYNGHAWPEVYFRGIGWLPFEPTVSYNDDVAEEAPYVYTPPIRLPTPEGPMMPLEPEEEEDDELEEAEAASLPAAFWLVLALLLFGGGVYAANILVNSGRSKNFKTAKTNAAVLRMLSYLLVFLKYCGFVMHNEEGLKGFAARVAPNFVMLDPEGWGRIAAIMQKARYSAHEITEGERQEAFDFIEALRTECRKKLKFRLRFKLQFVHFVL